MTSENQLSAARASARRVKAISEGRNPLLVTGERMSLVRISLPLAPVPRISNAPCTEVDPDLFFSDFIPDIEEAKALCSGCPSRRKCLAAALERDERWGVWGGVDLNPDHQLRRDIAS